MAINTCCTLYTCILAERHRSSISRYNNKAKILENSTLKTHDNYSKLRLVYLSLFFFKSTYAATESLHICLSCQITAAQKKKNKLYFKLNVSFHPANCHFWNRKCTDRNQDISAPADDSFFLLKVVVVVCSGLTSLSTIFLSYNNGVWLRQDLNAHFYSAASLKYHAPDTWHDTISSHIILTLCRPVLDLHRQSECQARSS